jgi:hypothetical protein
MSDGPYYFAWVNASDFVWDEYGLFARKDEQIVNYEVSQTEGEFASLSIDIRNPKIGLLSGTRKIWAWLSIDLNWAPGANNTPNIVPLFFGRLTGIPTNINQEIVTLELTARPADYVAQKAAFAETLKVAPYDPIWINPANLTGPGHRSRVSCGRMVHRPRDPRDWNFRHPLRRGWGCGIPAE